MVTPPPPPRLYIDTSTILDHYKSRCTESVKVIEALKKYPTICFCVTSSYTFMEILHQLQKEEHFKQEMSKGVELERIWHNRFQRQLSRGQLQGIYQDLGDKFNSEYKFITIFDLTVEGWAKVYDIASTTNIHGPDIIHVSTAIASDCTSFLTSDGFLAREVECSRRRLGLKCWTPQKMYKVFKDANVVD